MAYTENIVDAEVTTQGADTVIRFSGAIPLPSGRIVVRTGNPDGEVTLTPVAESEKRHRAWLAFLDELSERPADPDFMKDRPLNRLPVEKNLFPND